VTGPFLTIGGAAKFLGVSPRTIRRNLGKIPHYRCDFGLRFSSEDLSNYMADFRREPSRPPKLDLGGIIGSRKRRAG